MRDLFAAAESELGAPDVVLLNASPRLRGPLLELDPEQVRQSLETAAFGAFLVVQQAARRMVAEGAGAILLTGASASIKGFAQSAPFAMGKFALRGLAQGSARARAAGHSRRAFRHRRLGPLGNPAGLQ